MWTRRLTERKYCAAWVLPSANICICKILYDKVRAPPVCVSVFVCVRARRSAKAAKSSIITIMRTTLMPLWTVTTGGCLGVEVMVMVNIWLSRRLLSPSYTTKWKMSVTGWLPVSREVTYLQMTTSRHSEKKKKCQFLHVVKRFVFLLQLSPNEWTTPGLYVQFRTDRWLDNTLHFAVPP